MLLVALDRDFYTKLNKNKPYEVLVANCLKDYGYSASYTPLQEQHKGDLFVHDNLSDDCFFLEVKADYRIATTNNLLLELTIHRDNGNSNGWYYYDYTYMAVVEASRAGAKTHKQIWMIDFLKLKRELDLSDSRCKKTTFTYKNGNRCTAVLVPMRYVQARGWLRHIFYFDAKDWRQAKAESKKY